MYRVLYAVTERDAKYICELEKKVSLIAANVADLKASAGWRGRRLRKAHRSNSGALEKVLPFMHFVLCNSEHVIAFLVYLPGRVFK